MKPMLIAVLAVMPAFWSAVQVDGVLLRLVFGVLLSAPLYMAISYKFNHDWFIAMLELTGIKGSPKPGPRDSRFNTIRK